MSESSAPPPEPLLLVEARVRDAFVRKPHYVDGGSDLVTLCRELSERGLTHALVRDVGPDGAPRLGLFTTTDLRDALLSEKPPAQQAVREVARFELVEVDADADLFDAMWLMVRHRVHRLVVRDRGEVIGLLSQLDLVSFVADHSHIVALQIDDADSVAALGDASRRIDQMVSMLHAGGVGAWRIARLVGELHSRLLARTWQLLAPPEVVAGSCLLVMGSEGRGEQVLKTDQDNALLLRAGFDPPGLQALADRFAAAMAELGYPPCPGNIMVRNPLWRQQVPAFRETLQRWMFSGDPEGPMQLAIFLDAVPVAGDASLLAQARAQLDEALAGQDLFLARFAAAADQFAEPGNWLTRLVSLHERAPLDLKKLGIFPIVHGVRALALQHGVRETATVQRLSKLAAAGRLDASLARDLHEALHLLMGVRLAHQLRQRTQGQVPSNEVQLSTLSTLEREPLQDALAIVRRFRLWLRQHFRFDQI